MYDTACKMVKYCNRDCQIAHRPQHKNACKKRAKELNDEVLFKQPQLKDCPICFLTLPMLNTGSRYQSCCGNVFCAGCLFGVLDRLDKDEQNCPFCRTPAAADHEEAVNRMKKRVEVGDTKATGILGSYGTNGLPQDMNKALELWHRAAKLGDPLSCRNIGNVYYQGNGVEQDLKKAEHYWELAAIGGNACARYYLGRIEASAGNLVRAIKHLLIAVVGGHEGALNTINKCTSQGL